MISSDCCNKGCFSFFRRFIRVSLPLIYEQFNHFFVVYKCCEDKGSHFCIWGDWLINEFWICFEDLFDLFDISSVNVIVEISIFCIGVRETFNPTHLILKFVSDN